MESKDNTGWIVAGFIGLALLVAVVFFGTKHYQDRNRFLDPNIVPMPPMPRFPEPLPCPDGRCPKPPRRP